MTFIPVFWLGFYQPTCQGHHRLWSKIFRAPEASELCGISQPPIPDGFTTGLSQTRFFKREITGVDVPGFDMNQIRILGTPTYNVGFSAWCIWREVATSWDEILALGHPVTDGQTAPGATVGLGPEFVEWAGGLIDVVFGYGGSSEVVAAVDRGELDGTSRCFDYPDRLYPEWFERQYLVPIFWWENLIPDEWLQRWNAEQPPNILDIVDTTEAAKQVFKETVVINVMSRIFSSHREYLMKFTTSGWRPFESTVADPEYVRAAELVDQEIALGNAEDIREDLETIRQMSSEDLKLFVEIAGVD